MGAGRSLLVTFFMKTGIFLIAAVAFLVTAARAADEFVADELLVGFQPGARGARTDAIRNGLRASRIHAWPELDAEHWRLPPGLGVAQAIHALSANPNVLYAEPNYILQACEFPNDPRRNELWGLHNLGQTGGTPDADTDAIEAWQLPPGSAPVVVGVIDSGIDYKHEDLAGSVWVNQGEVPGNSIDDDDNGYVDDMRGWDFVNSDNDPMDDYGHGTHVAGTIAAIGNNGIGVIGVAGLNPNVQLLPLKFLNASGYGSTDAAINAINYAASFVDGSGNKMVRITSNSWGGGAKSKTLEIAIKNCGALFVAAAGNSGTSTVFYPAGYAQPNIIAVAATDSTDALASFSNYSATWVDLAAPGVSVLSTTPDDSYASWSGTSMATPHVSGVAALILSLAPAFSIADAKAQILASVDVVPSLAGQVMTGGRLNARQALGASELPLDTTAPAPVADLAATPDSPTSVTLTWTAPGEDGNVGTAYLYDIRYSINPILNEADFTAAVRANGEPNPQLAGTPETITVEDLPDNRTWYFVLKTIDEVGHASELSNPASATLPLADWHSLLMGWGQNLGNYVSLEVTSQGYWSVAYDDGAAGLLKCAVYYGEPGYHIETVEGGGVGAAVAYDASGEPRVSHVYGAKLLFASRIGLASWTSTEIERKDVLAGDTSLVYDGSGRACISYTKTGRSKGLWLARLNGSTWALQLVDGLKGTMYNQMAVDAAGNPVIAYSVDANGDGTVDTLKLARYNGTSWSSSVVEAGGRSATVAFDTAGNPAVAHWDAATGELRFLRWNGTEWSVAETVEAGPSITGCSLAFDPEGYAYLVYGSTELRLARRDPNSGVWTVSVVDPDSRGGLRNSVKRGPLMKPTGVAYRGPAYGGYPSTVQLALRMTPY